MIRRALKSAALRVLLALGGFSVARLLTSRQLRILCYHGFSLRDEHEFMPAMWQPL